jgi:hypothetical protein
VVSGSPPDLTVVGTIANTGLSISSGSLSGIGAASGDLVVAIVGGAGYDPDYYVSVPPTGWSNLSVGGSSGFGDGQPIFSQDGFYKEWDGSSSLTLEAGSYTDIGYVAIVIRDANNTSPKDASQSTPTVSGTSQVINGVTATVSKSIFIQSIVNFNYSGAVSYTGIGSGMTDAGFIPFTSQGGGLKVAYAVLSSSGATGTKTYTVSSAPVGAFATALNIKERT